MVDNEALKAAKERKRKAMEQYTGYDDEEFEEGRIGKKAEILAKYDDEFSTGETKTEVSTVLCHELWLIVQGFRLGAPVEKKVVVEDDIEMVGQAPSQKIKLNLDYTSRFHHPPRAISAELLLEDFETSDYLKEGDTGFKKPKVWSSTLRTTSSADSTRRRRRRDQREKLRMRKKRTRWN